MCTSYRERHLFVAADGCLALPNILPRSPLHHFRSQTVPTLSLGSEHSFISIGYGASRAVSVLSPASEKISFPPTLTSTNQRSPGANNHSVSFVNRPEKSLGSFFGSFNAPHLGAPGSRRLQNESLRVRTRVNLSQTRTRRQVRSHPRAVDARASNHDLSNLRAPLKKNSPLDASPRLPVPTRPAADRVRPSCSNNAGFAL